MQKKLQAKVVELSKAKYQERRLCL
ncbi:hypothetical protein LINPERHAP1_LOCUS32008 [Linum perenne]